MQVSPHPALRRGRTLCVGNRHLTLFLVLPHLPGPSDVAQTGDVCYEQEESFPLSWKGNCGPDRESDSLQEGSARPLESTSHKTPRLSYRQLPLLAGHGGPCP